MAGATSAANWPRSRPSMTAADVASTLVSSRRWSQGWQIMPSSARPGASHKRVTEALEALEVVGDVGGKPR